MADTRIKPEDFLNLTVAKYQRYLEKDLAKLSRKSGYKDYVCIYNYKGGRIKSKTTILIFAGMDDEQWGPILQEAVTKGVRYSSGTCKVLEVEDRDGDGDDDITIAIKTASGGMTKVKTRDIINEEIFPEDNDYEAVLMNDLDDETDKDLLAKRKNSSQGDRLQDDTTVANLSSLSNTDSDTLFDDLKAAIQSLLDGQLTTDGLYKAFLAEMTELKALVTKEEVGSKNVVDSALKLDIALEAKIDNIDLMFEKAEDWKQNAKVQKEVALDKSDWENKERFLFPLFKQFAALKKRLDRMESAVEENFGLGGEMDQAIDSYNDISNRLKKYGKLGNNKLVELLDLDEGVESWLAKLDTGSENLTEVALHQKFTELSELIDTEEKKYYQDQIKRYGRIRKASIALDEIPPTEYETQLDQIAELEQMIEEYEESLLNV